MVPTPPGWPSPPGFQQIVRLRAANLPDRDAIRSQPQRGTNEIGERGDAILGAERHEIGRLTLPFAGVLD